MRIIIIVLSFIITSCTTAVQQNHTDVSLQWKDSTNQAARIESETGDLYSKLSHHGPAIENEWLGLRLYFNHRVSIDVYNKSQAQLELAEAAWYPTPEQQKEGWGADHYKVGSTVGLGGVRLWDGEQVMFLDPVKKRTARVEKGENSSYMEMLSEGIPYKGDTIDVLVKVTVFSGKREAMVEAFANADKPVQFLTGINYHEDTKTFEGENFIGTWGMHPEDVAAYQMKIGAAIIYKPNDFEQQIKTVNEFQLVSKPTKYLQTYITSSCEKEDVLNTMDEFVKYLENYK
jgi:hypothetical protein